jgi:hypothetical protein
MILRLKPENKDVKTPFLSSLFPDHAVNDVVIYFQHHKIKTLPSVPASAIIYKLQIQFLLAVFAA